MTGIRFALMAVGALLIAQGFDKRYLWPVFLVVVAIDAVVLGVWE